MCERKSPKTNNDNDYPKMEVMAHNVEFELERNVLQFVEKPIKQSSEFSIKYKGHEM